MVTRAYSGSGFTLFGACLAAKANRGARRGLPQSRAPQTNAAQSFLEFLSRRSLVQQPSSHWALEAPSPRVEFCKTSS